MKKLIIILILLLISNISVYAENKCDISEIATFNNYSSVKDIIKVETNNNRNIYILKSYFGKYFVVENNFVSEEFSEINYKYFKNKDIFYLIGKKEFLGKSIIYKNNKIIEEFDYSGKISFNDDGKIVYAGNKDFKNILFDGEKYINIDDGNYISDIGFTKSGVFYYIEDIYGEKIIKIDSIEKCEIVETTSYSTTTSSDGIIITEPKKGTKEICGRTEPVIDYSENYKKIIWSDGYKSNEKFDEIIHIGIFNNKHYFIGTIGNEKYFVTDNIKDKIDNYYISDDSIIINKNYISNSMGITNNGDYYIFYNGKLSEKFDTIYKSSDSRFQKYYLVSKLNDENWYIYENGKEKLNLGINKKYRLDLHYFDEYNNYAVSYYGGLDDNNNYLVVNGEKIKLLKDNIIYPSSFNLLDNNGKNYFYQLSNYRNDSYTFVLKQEGKNIQYINGKLTDFLMNDKKNNYILNIFNNGINNIITKNNSYYGYNSIIEYKINEEGNILFYGEKNGKYIYNFDGLEKEICNKNNCNISDIGFFKNNNIYYIYGNNTKTLINFYGIDYEVSENSKVINVENNNLKIINNNGIYNYSCLDGNKNDNFENYKNDISLGTGKMDVFLPSGLNVGNIITFTFFDKETNKSYTNIIYDLGKIEYINGIQYYNISGNKYKKSDYNIVIDNNGIITLKKNNIKKDLDKYFLTLKSEKNLQDFFLKTYNNFIKDNNIIDITYNSKTGDLYIISSKNSNNELEKHIFNYKQKNDNDNLINSSNDNNNNNNNDNDNERFSENINNEIISEDDIDEVMKIIKNEVKDKNDEKLTPKLLVKNLILTKNDLETTKEGRKFIHYVDKLDKEILLKIEGKVKILIDKLNSKDFLNVNERNKKLMLEYIYYKSLYINK